jgi:hypothetical protein
MIKKHSPSMTFFEAKTKAWGEQPADERIDIPLGISFDDELLTKGTAATFYSNKLTTIKSSLSAALDDGEGCKPQTYNCRVLIDEGADARY